MWNAREEGKDKEKERAQKKEDAGRGRTFAEEEGLLLFRRSRADEGPFFLVAEEGAAEAPRARFEVSAAKTSSSPGSGAACQTTTTKVYQPTKDEERGTREGLPGRSWFVFLVVGEVVRACFLGG